MKPRAYINFSKKLINGKLNPTLLKIEKRILQIRKLETLADDDDPRTVATLGILITNDFDLIRDNAINASEAIYPKKKNIKLIQEREKEATK